MVLLCCVWQEPNGPDDKVPRGFPPVRHPAHRVRGGQQRAAQQCGPVRLLQEVHGAVFPAQHRSAHARPDSHIPEVPQGIRHSYTA